MQKSNLQSEVQKSVYDFVAKIPKGKVITYGKVARALGLKSPRIVGHVLHRNSDPERIPCHRVVFADGSLSHAYAFGGLNEQEKKLIEEGVQFNNNKVILK